MNKTIERILFGIAPFFLIALFVSGGEEVISVLEESFFANYLYKLSYPNTIIFNMSIGYLSGLFIYYLTGYVPMKIHRKKSDVITLKLFTDLRNIIDSIFDVVLKCSTEKDVDINSIDEVKMKQICESCCVNSPSGSKAYVSLNPEKFRDVLVREALANKWESVIMELQQIDNASSYINPEYYSVCLELKKSVYLKSILLLKSERTEGNTMLDPWHKSFYELKQKRDDINTIIRGVESE